MSFLSKNWTGLLACLIISIISWVLGGFLPVVGAPVFAIFIGMILYPFLTPYKQLDAGLTYSSKKLLQYAVILLGFGLNISQVFAVGKSSLPVILSTISIALIIAFFFQRFFNLDTKLATLIGVGSSICGGSAIAATAPVIHAKEKEVAQAISVIFFFNVLAALIFPTLGSWLHLSNEGFALFAGTAVNDTSSVTATASSWDSLYHTNTLESATIVKLTRTLAIIPITLFLSYWQSRQQDNNQGVKLKKIFPVFILYFILASLLTTGSSICGGSAIAATAPVIHAKEKEVAQAISVIFFFNVLAALIFPTLGSWLHLSNEGFALFAGTAVNDTSSVTATASSWDSLYHTNTLESATIVKLTRTLAIIPITLFLSYWQSRQQDNNQGVKLKKIFPVFILYFILASLLTTVLTSFGVSNSFFSPLKQLSKFLIIMAMSAIGLKTNLVAMIKSSGKSILLGALCWIAIILTSLGMQLLIGIF